MSGASLPGGVSSEGRGPNLRIMSGEGSFGRRAMGGKAGIFAIRQPPRVRAASVADKPPLRT
jgi:hypothetical protein